MKTTISNDLINNILRDLKDVSTHLHKTLQFTDLNPAIKLINNVIENLKPFSREASFMKGDLVLVKSGNNKGFCGRLKKFLNLDGLWVIVGGTETVWAREDNLEKIEWVGSLEKPEDE